MIHLLRAVKTAQQLGFTLAEIDEILRLSNGRGRDAEGLQARLREKVLEIGARIADSHAMRERLSGALHAGCDSPTDRTGPACPLVVEVRGVSYARPC